MPETTTAFRKKVRHRTAKIPIRRSVPTQPPGARRISSIERAREPARSDREQHSITPPQTLERRPVTQTGLTPGIPSLLVRIESEYREMPGLKLTEAQVRRLWDLDGDTCSLVLTTLIEQRFLKCTANGTYVRATD